MTHRSSTHVGDVREQLADLDARTAPCFANLNGDGSRLPVFVRSSCGISNGSGLPLSLVEPRLGVERVDVRRPARHEQEDDPLRPRREHAAGGPPADRQRPAIGPAPRRPKQPRQAEHAEAVGEPCRSACRRLIGLSGIMAALRSDVNRRRSISFVQSSTWQYAAQAASRRRRARRSREAVAGDLPLLVGRRPAEEDGVGPVDPRRLVVRSLGQDAPREVAAPASRTNGLLSRKSACGATVETVRRVDHRRRSRRRRRGGRTRSGRSGSSSGRACAAGLARSRVAGPPSVRSSRPATASRLSRIASASSRRRFIRPKRRFSGSARSVAGSASLDCW